MSSNQQLAALQQRAVFIMTKMDNSVLSRERALFNAFFEYQKGRGDRWMFTFARWRLIGHLIRQFKPNNTYCHLDGFDFDQFSRTSNAFTGVGRVWMLPEPGTPGDIATAISVEFDRAKQCVGRASIWFGPLVSRRHKAPEIREISPWKLLNPRHELDDCW